MKNVLMLLKTNGLEYDDRVRKESLSLVEKGYDVDIHVLENDNHTGNGNMFNNKITYSKYSLITRKLFKGNSFLFVKLLEFFFRLLPTLLRKQNVVWLHDPLMFVFVPFLVLLKKVDRINSIVWDQHELPPESFLKKKLFRAVYIWALKNVDVRLHANKERAEYLNNKLNYDFPYSVLRNFVDSDFVSESRVELPQGVVSWLDGEQFILLQSGAHKVRNFESVVNSICVDIKKKCIVVGGYDVEFINSLKASYPDFCKYFKMVGMVPQIRLVDYIDSSTVSLILYNDQEPNSLLCEPNRLYQSLSRGTPVIVGSNPSMGDIVKERECGVVINGCGNDSHSITEAVIKFYSSEPLVVNKVKTEFRWENQKDVFNFLDVTPNKVR